MNNLRIIARHIAMGKSPWNIDVYIVTWNVGTKSPDNVSFTELLELDKHPSGDFNTPDIYAFGLEEVKSQPQDTIGGLFKENPWTSKIKEELQKRGYVLLKTEQMQGLLINLYCKREHLLHIKDIQSQNTRTGFGGLWGNKGAVSIRLQAYGTAISFVAAHFAAHDEHYEDRINDYKQITEQHTYHVAKYSKILDHDVVFWFGDLNFRLTGEDSPEAVRKAVEAGALNDLVQRDQLLLARRTNRAFHNFEERLPEFPPTFKFKEGTSEYDMKRRPAWCDRILTRVIADRYASANITLGVERLSYKSHPEYSISDHKPVTGSFLVKVVDTPEETRSLEFSYIPIWPIGTDHVVEFWQPTDYVAESGDWIGIFKQNFSSLDDYVAYEYVNQAECHPADRRDYNLCALRIEFPENTDLQDGEHYQLIYFRYTGLRGVSSVEGMSNVFRAERSGSAPAPSPRFDDVD